MRGRGAHPQDVDLAILKFAADGAAVELYLNRDRQEPGVLTEIPLLWFAGA
jgi:hypothetical protein